MIAPNHYPALRWALAQKAKSLRLPVPKGYRTTLPAPPGRVMRQLIRDVQLEAKRRGLYRGEVTGELGADFQHYLVPPPAADVNDLAAMFLLAHLGPKEDLGSNRGRWLNAELDAMGEGWMHVGHQPWCAAIGGRDAYRHAGVDVHLEFPHLNDDYCPSWEAFTRAGTVSRDSRWRFVQVAVTTRALRRGDFLLFDWPGESPGVSDHFGRFLRPLDGGLETVEANTTAGAGGNQSEGGGIYRRVRPTSEVRVAGRLVKIGGRP